MTATVPKVSIITPTYGRESLLPRIYNYVRNQDFGDFEWLVLDDNPQPSPFMQSISNEPRLRYEFLPVETRLSLGMKLNKLNELARAEIIVQMDDDDYYAPNYVSAMVRALEISKIDVLGLSGWYCYDYRHEFFGYWDFRLRHRQHYVLSAAEELTVVDLTAPEWDQMCSKLICGYGFSQVYLRKVWREVGFEDMTWNCDGTFVQSAKSKFAVGGFPDRGGLALHFMHPGACSRCFPQFRIPIFLLRQLFRDPALGL